MTPQCSAELSACTRTRTRNTEEQLDQVMRPLLDWWGDTEIVLCDRRAGVAADDLITRNESAVVGHITNNNDFIYTEKIERLVQWGSVKQPHHDSLT